jgi:hypothetical protein
MRQFIRKLLGREEAKKPEQPKETSFDDITAWMVGEADAETRDAIARELDDPASTTSRHLAWQADPNKHRRGKGDASPDAGTSGRSR